MRRLLVLLLSVLFAACSETTPTPPGPDASTTDAIDASAVDGGVVGLDTGTMPPDAAVPDDAAMPPDAADPGDTGPKCTSQAQCGNPVENIVANVCQASHCHPPGVVDATGTLQKVDITFESIYAQSFGQPGNQPATQLTRFIWPYFVDGTPVTCADVKSRSGSTEAEATKLDKDPTINQAYRGLYTLVWGGSTPSGPVRFPIPANVPRGSYIVYAEAWRGPRDGQNPTGQRASSFCKENVDLSTIPATPVPQVRIDLNPQ